MENSILFMSGWQFDQFAVKARCVRLQMVMAIILELLNKASKQLMSMHLMAVVHVGRMS